METKDCKVSALRTGMVVDTPRHGFQTIFYVGMRGCLVEISYFTGEFEWFFCRKYTGTITRKVG
jgi:hypothetical protein